MDAGSRARRAAIGSGQTRRSDLAHFLRLVEYRLLPDSEPSGPLPGLNRVLYATQGEVAIISSGGRADLAKDAGWHGSAECSLRAGHEGARVLCFELYRGSADPGITG